MSPGGLLGRMRPGSYSPPSAELLQGHDSAFDVVI